MKMAKHAVIRAVNLNTNIALSTCATQQSKPEDGACKMY
jgi:hypothetical protein